MNLYNFFSPSIKNDTEKIAIICEDKEITFKYLDSMTAKVARSISLLTNSARSSVAVLSKNSINLLIIILALFRSGFPCTVLNWRLTNNDLSKMIIASNSQLLIFDDSMTDVAKGITTEIYGSGDRKFLSKSIDEIISSSSKNSGHFENYPSDSNDTAMILFTSGTTSFPKGAELSHGGLIAYAAAYIKESGWSSDTIYQTSAPMFHISGFSGLICLFSGGTLVLLPKFDPESCLEAISKYHVNRISLVPTTLQRLINHPAFSKYDISSIKKIVYGGSPMSYQLISTCLKLFNTEFEQGYGMTETGTITLLKGNDHLLGGSTQQNKLKSVGKPFEDVQIQIVGDDGKKLGPMEKREIVINSPSLFKGYCNNIEATKTKLIDGWYYSGDIGYFDMDGYLYVVDRKNDLIISGGENIYPKEIEACIQNMVDDVYQVAVVGIPDDDWGQVPAAFIQKIHGSSISEKDVFDYCRNNLARYKCPKKVFFVNEFETTSYGKILKRSLLNNYMEGKYNGK